MSSQVVEQPRSFGRPPVALKTLALHLSTKIEQELWQRKAKDDAVFVRAYWLRADRHGTGYPDYQHAYVWIAPILMSASLCEQIAEIVRKERGVVDVGQGGDVHGSRDPKRPFVYAVVNLRQRANG